jgi:hypothetical protein
LEDGEQRMIREKDVMARLLTRSAVLAGVVSLIVSLGLSGASAAKNGQGAGTGKVDLVPILSDADAVLCEVDDAGTATVQLVQKGGATSVRIVVKDSVPDMLLTVWMRLVGLSPLTDQGATAMVSTSAITEELIAVTPNANLIGTLAGEGDGGTGTMDLGLIPNGFLTDHHGDGTFKTDLDFSILTGAYPFQQVEVVDLDENGPRAFKGRPFAIVAHCLDESGHGVMFRDTTNPNTFDQPLFIFDPQN